LGTHYQLTPLNIPHERGPQKLKYPSSFNKIQKFQISQKSTEFFASYFGQLAGYDTCIAMGAVQEGEDSVEKHLESMHNTWQLKKSVRRNEYLLKLQANLSHNKESQQCV
jgi:hypothetical protein